MKQRLDTLDLICVAVVVLGGLNGFRIGFIRQITRLFGAVIAYGVAMWLRPYVTPTINKLHLFQVQPTGLPGLLFGNFAGAIAFTLVFIVTFLLLRYAAGLIDALFSLPVLSTINRLAGLVAGVALAVLFVYIVTAILTYVKAPALQLQLQHSAVTHYLHEKAATLHWQSIHIK